jgi:hypothetical protein
MFDRFLPMVSDRGAGVKLVDYFAPPAFSPSDGGGTTATKGAVTSRGGHQMLKEI